MKQYQHVSLWVMAIATLSAMPLVACVTDAGSGEMLGGGGTMPGAGAGGAAAGAGGMLTTAGTPGSGGGMVTAGATSGGMSGAGTGGMGAGGVGGTSGGTGGMSGGAAGSGGMGGMDMPFGPTSCSPVFATACEPNIVFENQDPTGQGAVFNRVIPDPVSTLKQITCTVCSIIYRDPSEIPQGKKPSTVKLVLDHHGGVAQTGGGQIQFDLDYIDGYSNAPDAKAKTEMLGVLQHEAVHLYQNYGNGGVGEGMADYVRIRVGYYEPGRCRAGGSWKDAYTTSGCFFSWLAGPCQYLSKGRPMHDVDIGYKINKVLGTASGDAAYTAVSNLFQQTYGENADQLWAEYQTDIK